MQGVGEKIKICWGGGVVHNFFHFTPAQNLKWNSPNWAHKGAHKGAHKVSGVECLATNSECRCRPTPVLVWMSVPDGKMGQCRVWEIPPLWALLIGSTRNRTCEYKCQIFPERLGLCLFDLLTVTFQGQTFLTVHDHREPFYYRKNLRFPLTKGSLMVMDCQKKFHLERSL